MSVQRWLPVLTALISCILIFFIGGTAQTFVYVIGAVIILPFIYFSDEIGSFTGWHWRTMTYIDEPTPGIVLKIIGWILLMGFTALVIFKAIRTVY